MPSRAHSLSAASQSLSRVQSLVVADILAGHDVLVASPTGSGKTLAFGVPLVDRIQATAKRPAALVLAPTRELATQIVEETRHVAHARALKIAAVYGGVSLERQAREAAQAHILVATPGRLEDLLQRRAFSLANVSILVLDEADRMLDMGFRPAVDRIVSQVSRDRQTVFLSATLTGEAGRIAQEYTVDARVHEHRPAPVPEAAIDHRFVACATPSAWTRCSPSCAPSATWRSSSSARSAAPTGSSSASAPRACRPSPCTATSPSASARRPSPRFEAGRVDTLVATDVAARGIDVDRISHVINFDPPEDRDAYTHRVGRTGRAGRSGSASRSSTTSRRARSARSPGR